MRTLSGETFLEKLDRVRAMAADAWGLEEIDRAALAALLAERAALRRVEVTAVDATSLLCDRTCPARDEYHAACDALRALRENDGVVPEKR